MSTTRYGELFVWTGKELKRYPKTYKERAAKTHRVLFLDNGFDADKIEASDSDELLKLSAWSWQNYVQSLNKVVTTQPANNRGIFSEQSDDVVAHQGFQQRISTPTERQVLPLPLMANRVPDNEDFMSDEPVKPLITIRSESMRICDTCFLKDKCPGFEANATCLYNIPVEIRTKPQLDALQDSIIEMQTHRVLFMKMAEDLGGGYADPNLSSEIDRLGRLVKQKTEAGKSTFSMTVTASENSPRESFVSKFLGNAVTTKVQALDAPIDPDAILAEVIDD